MIRINLSLILLAIVLLAGCHQSEELVEPTIHEAHYAPGEEPTGMFGTFTVKYRTGVDEETKQKIRNLNYVFDVISINDSFCDRIEIWYITYYHPSHQNGYTLGNIDTSKENFNPLDYIERVEFGWTGDCDEF